MTKIYDVAIIGAGPAGYSAAIYCKRKGLSTVIIGTEMGGQVMTTNEIENYPAIRTTTGGELSNMFFEHASDLGAEFMSFMRVEKIDNSSDVKVLHLDDGSVVNSKTIIIATGAKHRELGVKGEKEFAGRGVAYCATCDGPFYKGKNVVICGGGNTAIESAIDLSKIANHVTVVHRSKFRADKVLIDALETLSNVDIYVETQIEEIFGENKVNGLRATEKNTGKEITVETDGVFVEIGLIPDTDWLKDIVAINDKKEIIVNNACETSAKGIFAAGDVTDTPFKQIVVAAGDGAKAALSANAYLASK